MRLARWLVRWVPLDPRGRRAAGEVLADWHHEATLAASGLTRLGVAVRALAALARTLGFVTVLGRLPGTGGMGSRPPATGDAKGRTPMFDTFLKDLRYAVRTLAKSPAFTGVVVLSLALGIGATSTIFSAINPILLRPLPFEDPGRLVYISESSPDRPDGGEIPRLATYLEWKEHSPAFEELESVVPWVQVFRTSTIPGTVGPEQVSIQYVSFGLFRMLGVAPILGRNFVAEDALPGGDGATIISHGFWQRLFGGDPDIIGQKWGDGPIVGIMPPGFRIFSWNEADFWVPLRTDFADNQRWQEPIGRLSPGVSIEGAQTQLDGIARRLDRFEWAAESGRRVRVEPLHEFASGPFTSNLYLLLGAAVLLLLIACSNVASLLMGRAATRHHEITTRAALGAGRLRLMRQLLTESVVLALSGGVLGVVMAQVGTRLFIILAPTWYLPAEEIRVDGMVLGFTLGLSLLTAILFGMGPALRASNPDLAGSLKQGGRGAVGGSRPLVRNLLVGSQIALTFVLLAGAALMINSLVRLVAADRGFSPEHLLTATVDLSGDRYVTRKGERTQFVFVVSAEVDLFYGELLERLRVLPGVEAAEIASTGSGGAGFRFSILGRPVPPPGEEPRALYRETSPGYFQAMGVSLLKGRSFTEGDTESSPWVAIINEGIARQYFPDEDPIGRFLQADLWRQPLREVPPAAIDKPREIVGIVGDHEEWSVRRARSRYIYVPHTQHPTEYERRLWARRLHNGKELVLRTTLEPTSLAADVRRIVAEIDPNVAVDIETMEARLDQTVTSERFWMRALGIFATLALVLSVVGIYGVVSYAVARRTHEIGVRMALGAQRTDVLKMVVRQGMVMSLGGVVVGVLGAVAATRLLSNWLYEIEATDPATFATVAVVLVGIALLATYVPAYGAARVDPVNAMRSE